MKLKGCGGCLMAIGFLALGTLFVSLSHFGQNRVADIASMVCGLLALVFAAIAWAD